MAGERQLPGLGLHAYWASGSDGYRAQHSGGIRVLSALTQLSVKSRSTALPGSPTLGDIYIVPASAGTNANQVAIRDFEADDVTEAWVYLPAIEGMVAHVRDEDVYVRFNGSAWTYLGTVKAPAELAVSGGSNLGNGHFAPNVLVTASPATGTTATVTVPSGLSPFSTCHIVNLGAGDLTIAAGTGVTLQSKAAAFTLSGAYSFASIIPRQTANNYLVIGDLS